MSLTRSLPVRPIGTSVRHIKSARLALSNFCVFSFSLFLSWLVAPASFAAQSQSAVYGEARAYLLTGARKEALRLLRQASNTGKGTTKQAYQQRQQLLAQPAPIEDEPQRLNLFDAMNARERGDLELATQQCNEVIAARPASVFADDAQNLLAYMALVDRLDFGLARKAYSRLRERYPKSNYFDAALFGEALALEKSGGIEQAKALHQQLLDKHTGVAVGFLDLAYPKDNLLSRLWFNRAKAKLEALTEAGSAETVIRSSPGLIMGARLSYDVPVGSGQNLRSTAQWLQHYSVPATHIAHWLTENTVWEWESAQKLAAASRAGYTPVIIDWYFGDQISPSVVKQNRQKYLDRLQNKIIPLLAKTPNAMIILEPEFNKNGMEDWQPWSDLMLEAIAMIHRQSSARVGIGIGDWANFDDPSSLQTIEPAINASDFVAFLIMTSRAHEGAFHSPANDLGNRFNTAMTALKNRYDLPVVLAYTAISSADGWEPQQAHYLEQLLSLAASYPADELEAVGYFSLFDNPRQSGWFGRAEQAFGILDKTGGSKPSASAWRVGAERMQQRDRIQPKLGAVQFYADDSGAVRFSANFSEWVEWSLTVSTVNPTTIHQYDGAGRRANAQFFLRTPSPRSTDTLKASLVASDAAGNRVEKSFTTSITQSPAWTTLDELLTYEPKLEAGVTADRTSSGASRFSFRRPYGQVRLPVTSLPAKARIAIEIESERPLYGLYLGLEDRAGVRKRMLVDHMLPRKNSSTSTGLQVEVRDLLSAGLNLTSAGRISSQVASEKWENLVIENGTDPISFTLSELSIVSPGEGSERSERPIISTRWGN